MCADGASSRGTQYGTRSWAARALAVQLASVLHLTACGPEVIDHGDWMLGTFTLDWDEKVVLDGTTRYVLEEDGLFEVINVRGCNEHHEEVVGEYSWRYTADGAVEAYDPSGGAIEASDLYRISENADCNVLSLQKVDRGEVTIELPFRRGVMCMQDLPPCEGGFECDSCMTVWCEGSPPPCEDE